MEKHRGLHGVALLNLLWGLFVPLGAAGLYGWVRFSSSSIGELAVHDMDWMIWLVPAGLAVAGWATLNLYLRNASGRWLSLVLAGTAVVLYSAKLLAALVALDQLSPVPPLLMLALFIWPLRYLTRPRVRELFED